MTRAYALALGAGTQVFTKGIGPAVFGTSELTHDLSLGRAGSSTSPSPSTSSVDRPSPDDEARQRATAKVGS